MLKVVNMTNNMFTEIPIVLYQNRYCTQKDFDLVISESKKEDFNYVKNVYKVGYGSCTKTEVLDYASIQDITLTSGLNIWTLCNEVTKHNKNNDFKNYDVKTDLKYNLVQIFDNRVHFCASYP